MLSAICPVCDQRIWFDVSPKMHEALVCDACLSDLVVVALSPLELDILESAPVFNPGERRERKKKDKNKSRDPWIREYGGDEDDDDDRRFEKRKKSKPGRIRRRKEEE